MLEVNVSGIQCTIDNVESLASEDEIDDFLDRLSTEILELAQYYGAEDTGEMVGSIMILRLSSTHYQVICNAPQGFFNEFGTANMPASSDPENPLYVVSRSGKAAYRPFMRPAALSAVENIHLIV